MTAEQQQGSKKKERRSDFDEPCPVAKCRHPKADHRPVKPGRGWFCYARDCMHTCQR